MALDPLAALLRERYASRAELARVCGLGYQMLRTYTDGRWTADHLPPVRVMAALSLAVEPGELQAAVRQAMLARTEEKSGLPEVSFGQRVVLEALRGFDDELLVAVAPHVHDLGAGVAAPLPGRAGSAVVSGASLIMGRPRALTVAGWAPDPPGDAWGSTWG